MSLPQPASLGVELRGMHFDQHVGAVRHRFTRLRGLQGCLVGKVVAHLPGGREGDAGFGEVGQEGGLGSRGCAWLRSEERRHVCNFRGGQLGGHRVHHRVLARAVLERLQLRLEVAGSLGSEVGDRIADADAVGAVAGRAYGFGLGLAGGDVGRLRERRGCEDHANCKCLLHNSSLSWVAMLPLSLETSAGSENSVSGSSESGAGAASY